MKMNELTYLAYADLFKQLALLMHSGVSLSQGLLVLSEEEKDAAYRQVLQNMSEQMEEGASLASALTSAGCFPAHSVGLIEVAERVGRTEETLRSLSDYYETRDRISRSLQSALTYPTVLLLMMLAVIVLLLSKVLPVFDDVYQSLGGSLTGVAGGLLKLGDLLNAAMPVLGIAAGAVLIVYAVIALIPAARRGLKGLANRLFGDLGIGRKINNALFAQAFSMVLASGLPIEEGVELASKLFVQNPAVLRRCRKCQKLLDEGTDLVSALQKAKILSSSACRMLSVGMRTGNGDTAMQQISSRMSDEAEEALESSVARIESALVLVTSFMVGAILLAVMLPLINIMNAIG